MLSVLNFKAVSMCVMSGKCWLIVIPFSYGIGHLLHAFDLPTEWVHCINILGEDLLEEVKVFGVESDAIAGDGISDGEVV